MDPVVATIVCGGARHEVSLSARGRMRLVHHDRDAIEAELAAFALGGRLSPCVSTLYHWRTGRFCRCLRSPCTWKPPMDLVDAWIQRAADPSVRIPGVPPTLGYFSRLVRSKDDPFALDKFGRLATQIAAKPIADAFFRAPVSLVIHVGTALEIESVERTKKRIRVGLLPTWWRDVYLRGLSVIDHKFILRATVKGEKTFLTGVSATARTNLEGYCNCSHARITNGQITWIEQMPFSFTVPSPFGEAP